MYYFKKGKELLLALPSGQLAEFDNLVPVATSLPGIEHLTCLTCLHSCLLLPTTVFLQHNYVHNSFKSQVIPVYKPL